MLSNTPRRSDQRAAIATDIRDIFNAPSGGEAEAMLRARVEQYYDRNPELADWMETNLPEGFTVFRFARSTWRRIRTNNGAGEPKPSDSPAYPGRRYLSKHRVRTTTHHRCRRGDSRRLADRETVPQPGRFQTTGESDLRSLSVKLQKNSCLAESVAECTRMVEELRRGVYPNGRGKLPKITAVCGKSRTERAGGSS